MKTASRARCLPLLLFLLLAALLPTRGAAAWQDGWYWPLGKSPGYSAITSAYGYRQSFGRHHDGLDLGAAVGTPVYAARGGVLSIHCSKCTGNTYGGKITCTTPDCRHGNGLGNYLSILHPDGTLSLYGHLSQIVATSGETVAQGDCIAYVGNTGSSTGPHLHFAIKKDGAWCNPNPADCTLDEPGDGPGEIRYLFSLDSAPVPGKETLSVCPDVAYPLPRGTLPQGKSYSIRGSVVSSQKLTGLTVGIYDAGGKALSFYDYGKLSAAQVSLRTADSTLKFGTLAPGSYTLRMDAVGTTAKESFLYPFTIAAPAVQACTVKLLPQGGSLQSSSVTVTLGKTYGVLPTPLRAGYDFSGWFTQASGGTKISQNTAVSAAITQLFAQWTAAEALPLLAPLRETGTLPFVDVPGSSWYAEPVAQVYRFGLMSGVSARYFAPQNTLSVAESITLAARLHNRYHSPEDDSALSVAANPWYQPYVDYARAEGILTQGFDRYDRPCTRGEFAWLLAHALPERALPRRHDTTLQDIPDLPAEALFAEEVLFLYQRGILTGVDSAGRFAPQKELSRSEAAAVCARLVLPSLRS